ncbi:hypothetical protein V8C86DRAFT_1814407 [Haematococcus lacustris]
MGTALLQAWDGDKIEAGASAARLRWAIHLDVRTLSHPAVRECLEALLPLDEQAAVARFLKADDQVRALVSRLLQRAAIARVCHVKLSEARIQRTKGGKPFSCTTRPPDAPNFNFNVSHEGDWVVLASEPVLVVGCDVAGPQQHRPRPGRTWADTLKLFKDQLSEAEWGTITGFSCEEQQAAAFQRHWSLKEAFVKARGDGLGFAPLSRASFTLSQAHLAQGLGHCAAPDREQAGAAAPPLQQQQQGQQQQQAEDEKEHEEEGWQESPRPVTGQLLHTHQGLGPAALLKPRWRASLTLDGRVQDRWLFDMQQLGKDHWVGVACTSPDNIVDAHGVFKASLRRPEVGAEEVARLAALPPPAWQVLTVADLLESEPDTLSEWQLLTG